MGPVLEGMDIIKFAPFLTRIPPQQDVNPISKTCR